MEGRWRATSDRWCSRPSSRHCRNARGSRRQYARLEEKGSSADRLGPEEAAFIAERDSFYMASVGSTGWPYVQHRGGPAGFLKVIDEETIALRRLRAATSSTISVGNLTTDDRVALILVDYPQQARLKILGRARTLEGEQAKDWLDRVRDPGTEAAIERVVVIHVEAFDWNCQQHITPRFTVAEIEEATKLS